MTEIFEDVHFNFTATDYTVVLIAKRNETVLSSVPVVLKRSTGRYSVILGQLCNLLISYVTFYLISSILWPCILCRNIVKILE